MAIGSGVDGQVGFVSESEYGTVVTVTRFLEFISEGLKANVGKIYGKGIGRGRLPRSDRVKTYVKDAGGPISFEFMKLGCGLLLKHMFGALATEDGGDPVYVYTATPDTAGKAGLSATFQVGRPSIDGTVQPFTYGGCKIPGWEFKVGLDEPLTVQIDIDAKNVVTSTALASKTYAASNEQFIFTEGALTIGGTTKFCKNVSIKWAEPLSTGRRGLTNTKKEPIANGMVEVTGTIDAEFEDLTAYAAFLAGTQAALVLTFTTAAFITGSTPFLLTITIPKIEYTEAAANVDGPDIVMQSLPFKALYDGSNALITAALQTSDTTP